MTQKIFVENIIIEFSSLVIQGQLAISESEYNALMNFYQIAISDEQFTLKQRNYVLVILSKYSGVCKSLGLDYTSTLISPEWKHGIRVIDNTKLVWVEEIEDEKWICLKIPFSLKDELEKISQSDRGRYGSSVWDHENKIRKLKLYDYNIIHLNDFFEKNKFERHSSFLEALSEVESIWEQQEQIIPRSVIVDDEVNLINTSDEVIEYFESIKQHDVSKDLMLARSMGFFYNPGKNVKNIVEKICSSTATNFWIRDINEFFKLYKSLDCKVAVITDKDEKSRQWIRKFVEISGNYDIPKDDIKVCFRLGKEDSSDFNDWIKETGVGGSVENGKIFIFHNKPAKWLFSSDIDVKIIATDSLYPVPNAITQTWMNSHPCVCYLGELRASQIKDKDIVNL